MKAPGRGRVRAAFLAFAAAAALAQAAAAAAFFIAVPDLPLMPGLTEDTDMALVFDDPGGRIVDVSASGTVVLDAARSFYAATLPQLGWIPGGAGAFERGGETLTVIFEVAGPAVVARFQIAPRHGPGPP